MKEMGEPQAAGSGNYVGSKSGNYIGIHYCLY